MMSNRDKFINFFKTLVVSLLSIFSVALKIGFIIWLYTLLPINRIVIVISYIVIAPLITWILKKAFQFTDFGKLYLFSLFISSILLTLLITLLGNLEVLVIKSELLDYISTVLFAILIYYFFGNNNSNNILNVKTIKDSYVYSYSFMSVDYDVYFIKTLVFVFYAFTLIFGQLRDLGIHNSSLFKYEQYAIILIIAIDRIVNSFSKDFTNVKDQKQRRKEKDKETLFQALNAKSKDIKKQFELLLKINPEYDIEKLDLWENANDSEHPQTKLLHLYILFNVLSEDNSDKIDELFILVGKSVKRNLEIE